MRGHLNVRLLIHVDTRSHKLLKALYIYIHPYIVHFNYFCSLMCTVCQCLSYATKHTPLAMDPYQPSIFKTAVSYDQTLPT